MNDKDDKLFKILTLNFERIVNYHDQKEKMIHAGILLQIGLLIAVFRYHIPQNDFNLYCIAYVVFWTILYFYIRLHSVFKRTAAVYRVAYERTLWASYNNKLQNENITKEDCTFIEYIKLFLTILFPIFFCKQIFDVDVTNAEKSDKYYPDFFIAILRKSKKRFVGSTWYEFLVAIGSIAILIIGICKMINDVQC